MADLVNDQNLESVKLRAPVDSVWVHKTYGGHYKISGHHEGADEYENGAPLTIRISYTQLEDGKVRAAGSPYSRTATNFFDNFEVSTEESITLPKVP